MVPKSENFNELEKSLINNIPPCIISAIRGLPNNFEYTNALRYIKLHFDGAFNSSTELYRKQYNQLEIHMIARGVPVEVVNGLRAAYLDETSHYKALGLMCRRMKREC
ncbi:MAG: hypothetical protein JW791_01145 [Nanoarchaeota archaeon]|nr:hypothetical protein [Nanoarchaeota archaeon]